MILSSLAGIAIGGIIAWVAINAIMTKGKHWW